MEHEALWYDKLEGGCVRCTLCPHGCRIAPGQSGLCRARINENGTLFAASYARTVSLSTDPVEKKPLYHFLPGEPVVSIGHNSCNLRCRFCQNYTISQFDCPTFELPVEQLPAICRRQDSRMVAFTYTEPVTWFEYVLDAAKLLHEQGIRTVMVSNGFINPEPLEQLIPHIDAWNIDLKAMTDDFYHRLCGAHLNPVLQTIRRVHGRCHLELTNLVVPGENDYDPDDLIEFVAELDRSIPVHFSRYFPRYQMTAAATPEHSLLHFFERARERLHYVYLGNMHTVDEGDTHCPRCGHTLVERNGYTTRVKGLRNDRCVQCGQVIAGVWT